MEYLVLIVLFVVVMKAIYYPDTNSTSYKLGRGMGSKTRKLGEWIMKE